MFIKVYIESINRWGEVTSRAKIAEFMNMNWAHDFIKGTAEKMDGGFRIIADNKELKIF